MKNAAHSFPSVKTRLALGAGFFAAFFLTQGINILAVPYYQMTLGVDPAYLGILMAVPLLLASSFGAYIGYWSDKFKNKFGTRRPIIFVSALVCLISYGMVWEVSPQWNQTQLLIYFALTSFIFNIASVCYTVPLNSLTYEISDDSEIKLKVLGFTAYFVKIGAFIYQWIFPLSQAVLWGSIVLGVQHTAWLLAVLVFGLLGIVPALCVKEMESKGVVHQQKQSEVQESFFSNIKKVLLDRHFCWVLCIIFLQMGISAACATMDHYLLVYDVYAGDIAQGANNKAKLSSAYALMSALYIPIAVALATRWGKIKALMMVYAFNVLGGCLKWFIFVPNIGSWVVVDAILCAFIWSAMVVIVPSLIADFAQASPLGKNHTGLYASLYTWVLSASSVLVVLLNGFILKWIHFDALLGGHQLQTSLLWMRIILSVGTVATSLIALAILYKQDFKNHFKKIS